MQRNPHSYQIATGYRTFYSLSLIYQPITKKRLFFIKKLLPCKQKNNNIENTRLVMKLIFGFDLGSTSIGWAVVQEKGNDTEASRILKLGVRVNPLTTDEKTNFEKGKPITTNANRRLAHGMRLNLSRYKQRRKELIKSLIRFKFISPDTVLCENGSKHHV